MGAVVDEETGEEPTCMFCHSTDDCPHLVAAIDRTFAECNGGALFGAIDDLRELLSTKILARLRAREGFKTGSAEYGILAIANEAQENYDSNYPDDVYIDDFMFLSWLTEMLIDCGAVEPAGYIVEEGGPCQSSALSLLYDEDPQKILKSVKESLIDALSKI